jgi:histone H3/H4
LKRVRDFGAEGQIKCRKTFIAAFEAKVENDLLRSLERAQMSGRKTLMPSDV